MPTPSDVATLWLKAVEKYVGSDARVKIPEELDKLTASDFSVDGILNEVETHQEEFKIYRSKNKKLRDALVPFTSTVKTVANAVGHGVKLVFPPAETICNATIVLLKAAEGVSANYDAIAEMLEALNGFLDRLKIYVIEVDLLIEKMVVENLAQILVVLCLARVAVKEKRTIAYFKTLVGKNSKVHEAMAKLDRLSTREGHTVSVTILSSTRKILQLLEERLETEADDVVTTNRMLIELTRQVESVSNSSQDNQVLLEEIKDKVFDMSNHQLSLTAREVRQWLHAPDPSTNHYEARRKRTPGTGAWLLQDYRYLQWKTGHERHSIIWLSGRPGCGKSILSSTIIEDIAFDAKTEKSLANPTITMAYFYFDFRDSEKQTCYNLSLSLIDQLAFPFVEISPSLEKLFSLRQSNSTRPTQEELLCTIHEICTTSKTKKYIVIDALDECKVEDWHELTAMLEEIQSWQLINLRVLCTSRREEVLREGLSSSADEIYLESSLMNPDIARFVEVALTKDPRFAKWRNRKRETDEIRTVLAGQANGMFRWAFCQLESLSKCITPRDLFKTLRNLPKTLYETYERILLQIDSDHYPYTFAVLQWLSFSLRRMKLKEVAEVLAITFETDMPIFDENERIPEPRDILSICKTLVICNEYGYLELAHFSVKEYLLSGAAGQVKQYTMDTQLAHTFIARSCIAYLLHFRQPFHFKMWDLYPLAHYAAKYWIQHYRNGAFRVPRDTVLLLLCADAEQYTNWVKIYDIDDIDIHYTERSSLDRAASSIPPQIYYAAFAGLEDVMLALIAKGADVNSLGGAHSTPLHAAIMKDHLSIVRLLLANGADVDIQYGKYGTPLYEAASRDKPSSVEILLEYGADINLQGRDFETHFETPLQTASRNGHESVVQILLEKSADINIRGGRFGTALQVATRNGHLSVAHRLLANGANANIHSGEFGTALHEASRRGVVDFVQFLLHKGAEMDIRDKDSETALQIASGKGHSSVVQLLLENGADGNIRGGKYWTALQMASRNGHKLVVQLLLSSGAHVNDNGGYFGTALQAASRKGHISIVQLLLNSGADINMQGGYCGTAIHAASTSRVDSKALVQLLLQSGADANILAGSYGTALQAASDCGNESVVRLLLEVGSPVNVTGGMHGTALQAASYHGHDQVVKLLLDNGADPNIKTEDEYGTALQAATMSGSEPTIRLLLANGADVNLQGGYYGTALQAASASDRMSLVRLFLGAGADANSQGGYHKDALQAASLYGHESVVRLLLDAGADINRKSEPSGFTALQTAYESRNYAVVQLLIARGADKSGLEDELEDLL